MTSLKKWTIRTIMTAIFFGALFTTFYAISGVEAKSLVNIIKDTAELNNEDDQSNVEHTYKPVGVAFKFLEKVTNLKFQVTASEAAAGQPLLSLEESVDWTQYEAKEVIATGYTAFHESTGKHPDHPEFGITYSGVKVKRDLYSTVAADLDVFPIGTILFVPGYGYGVVADKGGAIKGNRVDLYYETVEDVYSEWGKKTLDVYVVEMGNGTLTEDDLRALNENEAMQVFRQQYN